jgi:hypothetical protein
MGPASTCTENLVTPPSLTGIVELIQSDRARPLIREAVWAAGLSIGLIVLSAIVIPAIAYAVYLAVGVFFACILTGTFVSILEQETGESLFESPPLRRLLAGCAVMLAVLAAVILV